MKIEEKVLRILQTRKGSVPTNPEYGSRIYLLRDRRASEVAVYFSKYAHEDIEKSDPKIKVKKATLINIFGNVINGNIQLANRNVSVSIAI